MKWAGTAKVERAVQWPGVVSTLDEVNDRMAVRGDARPDSRGDQLARDDREGAFRYCMAPALALSDDRETDAVGGEGELGDVPACNWAFLTHP